MCLSREQEQELIEINMPKICRAVDNFVYRCHKPVVQVPYEDFVQEVSIVFLEHIRKSGSMEEIDRFPWYSAMQAMTRLVLTYQPMSVPKRSGGFGKIVSSMPRTVSYETSAVSVSDVDGMSRHWVDDKDTMMDFELFVNSLPDYADRLIAMRLWGIPFRKIAAEMGVTEDAVMKRMSRYHQKYHQFISEEDEHD